uniref:CCHC-type domain-containing protein n=1 Tax=Fagus sylvatica TaxID=28930 RepID=A0A2N9EX04_FAGSY
MAPTMYIVYLRFNGEIIYGQNGAEYQGPQMKFIRVHRGISFVELETKIFNALQLDNQSHRITVTYRYPQEGIELYISVEDCVGEGAEPLTEDYGDGLEAEDYVGEDLQQMTMDDTAPLDMSMFPLEVNPLHGVHDMMMVEFTANDEEENTDYDNDAYFDDDDDDVHNDEVDDVVWDAKQKAITKIYEDWEESYQLLPKFMKTLINLNLGTKVEWKTYWSADAEVEKWTLAKDDGRHYGAMTTNLSECFNGVLKGARNLPITVMVEFIYFKLVHYFNDRRIKTQAQLTSGLEFSTHAMDKFEKWSEKASLHHVIEFNQDEACASQHINVYQYIDPFYSLTEMLACYQPQFQPMKDALYWEDPNFPMLEADPRLIRQRGRPKSTRLRNEMDWRENQHKQSCGLCNKEGHNRRKCPNAISHQ